MLVMMQAWCTAWWKAEREEALRQLDDLTDAPNAWQPALTLLTTPDSSPGLDILEDDTRYHLSQAWLLRIISTMRG